jgi:uncharacterized membrane protein YhfC
MQVSNLSIVFMAVSAIVSIGLPIGLFIIFHKKYKIPVLPMIVGMAAFIIFALILERSIHTVVFDKFTLKEKPFAYVLYGIFMAGIFEETARFISFTILKRKYHGIGTGLSYGIGHGGIEAILLVGIAMINSIVFSFTINTGIVETITEKLQGEALEQTNIVITTLLTTAPYLFLIGGIERIFALCIQISLSVIMFYSVFCKKKAWLFPVAIIIHAIIDLPAVVMQTGVINNVFLVEGIICLSSILVILCAKYIHEKLRQDIIVI